MGSIIPLPLLEILDELVEGLLTTPNGGLLSVGILVTLWSASRCMKHIQAGVDRAYGLRNPRLYLTSRFFAVVIFIAIMVLLIIFILVFTFGEPLLADLLGWLGMDLELLSSFRLAKWLGTFLGLFITFSVIYRITPNIKHKFRDAFPGALLATGCLMALVQIYAAYLGFSSRTLSAYGVLSAFFVLMIWLRLIGYIILLGALLNATVFEYRYGKPQKRHSKIDALLYRFWDWLVNKINLRIQPPDEEDSDSAKG
jgi:membrane protein